LHGEKKGTSKSQNAKLGFLKLSKDAFSSRELFLGAIAAA
jgi:hypothetical protein